MFSESLLKRISGLLKIVVRSYNDTTLLKVLNNDSDDIGHGNALADMTKRETERVDATTPLRFDLFETPAVIPKAKQMGGGDQLVRLKSVQQLSGVNDTLFVEAFVRVHKREVHLETVVTNMSADILTSLSVDLTCGQTQGLRVIPLGMVKGVSLAPRSSTSFSFQLRLSRA